MPCDWLLSSTCFLHPLGIPAPVSSFRRSAWIRGIWRSTGLRTSFWPFSRSITACRTAFRRCTSSLSSKASFETAEVRRAGDWVGQRAKAQRFWVRFPREAFFRDLKMNYSPALTFDQCSLRKSDRKCILFLLLFWFRPKNPTWRDSGFWKMRISPAHSSPSPIPGQPCYKFPSRMRPKLISRASPFFWIVASLKIASSSRGEEM